MATTVFLYGGRYMISHTQIWPFQYVVLCWVTSSEYNCNPTHTYIKEVRCYEAKIEESEKRPAAAGNRIQDTSGLSRQCSATELRQPDNHQPSQSILPAFFTFLYFHLITSNFLYFQLEARYSLHIPT